MVLKRNGLLLLYISILIFTMFISCNKKFTNFDEYLKNVIFKGEKIMDDKTYILIDIDYKTRIIYSELGTSFNLYDNPNGNILLSIKYWTEIKPLEIISSDGIIWVKTKTKDNQLGWIKSHFIEIKS